MKSASDALARRAIRSGELSFGSMPLTASKIATSNERVNLAGLGVAAVVPSSRWKVKSLRLSYSPPWTVYSTSSPSLSPFDERLQKVVEAHVAGLDLHHQLDQRAGRNDVEAMVAILRC